MATISFPASLTELLKMTWGQTRRDAIYSSVFGSQGVEASSPLWNVSLQSPIMHEADSGAWKVLMMQLKGRTNNLALHDFNRPAPLGTMRGTMVLGGNRITAPTDLTDAAYDLVNGATSTATTVTDANAGAHAYIRQLYTDEIDPVRTWRFTIDVTKDAVAAATRFSVVRLFIWNGANPKSFDVAIDTSTGDFEPLGDAVASDVTVTDVTTHWRVTLVGSSTDTTNNKVSALFIPAIGNGLLTDAYDVTTTGTAGATNLKLEPVPKQGDSAITIYASGETSETLLAGDLIGFGTTTTQQVVMVTADATSNAAGIIDVDIQPPLRNDHATDASVTWDKPTALFRRVDSDSMWEYSGDRVSGFSLDLIEDWR